MDLTKPRSPRITRGRSGKHVYRKGEVVLLGHARVGVVKFVGPIEELDADLMYGIEIRMTEGTLGQCDGTINGHRYFKCASDCGVFVRPEEVKRKISSHELLEKVVTLTKKCSSLRRLVKVGPGGVEDGGSARPSGTLLARDSGRMSRDSGQFTRRKNSRSANDAEMSLTTHTRSYSTPVSMPWEEKLEPEFPSVPSLVLVDSKQRRDALQTISMWSATRVLSWLYTFAPRNSSASYRLSSSRGPSRVPSFDNYQSPTRDSAPVPDDNLVDEWQEVFDIFEEHGVNGRELVDLDTQKLNSMGIVDATICWKILHEIDKLCDSSPNDSRNHDNDDSKMFNRMREFFRSLDEDGDGCIRISDWRAIVYENAPFRYQQMLTEVLIHQAFNEFNITKSGSLSEDEFVIALGVFYLHRKRRRSVNNKFNPSIVQKDSPKIVFLYALKHILRKICGTVVPRNSPGAAAAAGSPALGSGDPYTTPLRDAQSFGVPPTDPSSGPPSWAGNSSRSLGSYASDDRFHYHDGGKEGEPSERHLSGDSGVPGARPRARPVSTPYSRRVRFTQSMPAAGFDSSFVSRQSSEPGLFDYASSSVSMIIPDPTSEFNIPAQPSTSQGAQQYLHTRVSSTGSIKTGSV